MSKKRTAPKRPEPVPQRGRVRAWELVVIVGVLLAAFGTGLTTWQASMNAFGPPKYFVATLSALVVAIGLVMGRGESTGKVATLLRSRWCWPFLAVTALMCVATVVSVDPARSVFGVHPELRGMAAWMAAGVVGIGAWCVFLEAEDSHGTDPVWTAFTRTAVCVLALVAIGALAQVALADRALFAAAEVEARPRSTLGNASNLGVWLCAVMPLVFATAIGDRTKAWRIAGWASFGLGFAALSLSLSRGAWVGAGFAAAAGVLFWWHGWTPAVRARVVGAMAVAFAIAAIGVYVLVPSVVQRASEIINPSSDDARYRIVLWGVSAEMAAARPLAGWGPSTFSEVFPPYRPMRFHRTGNMYRATNDPHNSTMSLAMEAGPLAALALLAGIVALVYRAWGLRRTDTVRAFLPVASVLAAFVATQFHFVTVDTAALMVTSLVAALAWRHVVAEPSQGAVRVAASVAVYSSLLVGAVLAFTGLAVFVADGQSASAKAMAERDWPNAEAKLDAARAWTEWSPVYDEVSARIALERMAAKPDGRVFAYGREAFSQALRGSRDPIVMLGNADLHMIYAVASKDEQSEAEATRLYRELRAWDPTSPGPWYGLGVIAASGGQVEEARTLFEEARARDKRSVAIWAALERTYEALGDADKARYAETQAEKLKAKE